MALQVTNTRQFSIDLVYFKTLDNCITVAMSGNDKCLKRRKLS